MTSEEVPANTRALKIIVIALGIVFLVMLVIFVIGFATRFKSKNADFQATLRLEAGEVVTEIAGAGDRLALRVKGREGRDRVVFVDPTTGKPAGSLDLIAGP